MSHATPKYFVIDDDESVRISLDRLLRSAGFQCATFHCGEEFIASLTGSLCGCAIVDVHMPGMSGIELMKLLRRVQPDMRVVLITAFDDAEAEAEAANAGTTLLKKPFDDAMLLGALLVVPVSL